MNEREYDKLRKQVRDEYEKKLEALDLVYEMSKCGSGGVEPLQMGELSKAVRSAVEKQSVPFTVRDVEVKIIESHPEHKSTLNRTSISSALKRLANDEVIVMKERGSGKRPTLYENRRPVSDPAPLPPLPAPPPP